MQGYLNNLFAFLAGSCIILFVGIVAQLCWPQSLKDKRLFMASSRISSSQSYCSDVHSLDSSEVYLSSPCNVFLACPRENAGYFF